jgi:hypothetical protein
MDREQVLQQAKDAGWRVVDLRTSGVDRDIPWAHWEVIQPGRGPIFRAMSEAEAWEYVYVRLMDEKPGEV